MKMKVENYLNIYEVNGKETETLEKPKMKVKNHWNINRSVVIEIDGNDYTVNGEDLKIAIENSQRVC